MSEEQYQNKVIKILKESKIMQSKEAKKE